MANSVDSRALDAGLGAEQLPTNLGSDERMRGPALIALWAGLAAGAWLIFAGIVYALYLGMKSAVGGL